MTCHLSLLWLLTATGLVATADGAPLLTSAVVTDARKNFVANSGFETVSATGIAGWHNDSETAWRPQSAVTHSGSHALAVSGNEAFGCRTSQTVDLQVGETYTLSAWMKSEGLTTTGPGEGTVGLKVIDAGWYWSAPLSPAPTGDWQHYSVTFRAPASAHYPRQEYILIVYVPRHEKGTLWVDDIQIERGAQATAYAGKAIPDLARAIGGLNQANAHLEAMPAALGALKPATPARQELHERVGQLQLEVTQAAGAVQRFETIDDDAWAATLAVAERVPRQVRQMAWLAWWTNPWEYYSRRQAPSTAAEPAARTLELAVNDYMPLALNLTNLGSGSVDLRARLVLAGLPDKPTAAGIRNPPWATLRQARMVSPANERGTEYPAVLARLDDSQTLSVGAGETTQLWLDVDSYGLEPGTYTATLELVPQQDLEPRTIPLTIRVLPVRLPEECPAEVFCWGQHPLETLGEAPDMSQEEINRLQDPWLRDLKRHGVNRILHHTQSFTPQFAADDTLAAPIDFTWHDKLLASKRRYVDNFVGGYSVAHYHMPAVPDAQFERRFGAMMKAWIAHLQELGLTPRQLPFEMMDEPSGDRAQIAEVAFKVLKQIAPDWLSMSAVSFDIPGELTNLSRIMEIMVVQPNLTAAADEALRQSGREIWTYQCSGSLGTLQPYSYYRMESWVTWAKGYTGFGFYWTMANMDSPRDNVYAPYTYGSDGPVPSRGWQAFWRGTRDWTTLAALRDAIEAAREAGQAEKAAGAEEVLKQAVADVAGHPDDATRADDWRRQLLDQLLALQ
jgi:hypothetical protein